MILDQNDSKSARDRFECPEHDVVRKPLRTFRYHAPASNGRRLPADNSDAGIPCSQGEPRLARGLVVWNNNNLGAQRRNRFAAAARRHVRSQPILAQSNPLTTPTAQARINLSQYPA